MTNILQRHHMKKMMEHFSANHNLVHYPPHDVRTMSVGPIHTDTAMNAILIAGKMVIDCSQNVELFCHVAGLKDPSGPSYNYRIDGYTGSFLHYLPEYDNPANADVGAIVIFGPGTGDHACQVHTPGKNPLLYSHGSNNVAHLISFSVEKTFHRSPARFLDISHL